MNTTTSTRRPQGRTRTALLRILTAKDFDAKPATSGEFARLVGITREGVAAEIDHSGLISGCFHIGRRRELRIPIESLYSYAVAIGLIRDGGENAAAS